MPSPLRPSAHAKLTAQWEWRTMQEEGGGGTIDSRWVGDPTGVCGDDVQDAWWILSLVTPASLLFIALYVACSLISSCCIVKCWGEGGLILKIYGKVGLMAKAAQTPHF